MDIIQTIALNSLLFGMHTDLIINHIENYAAEIKRYSDWELELEIKAQVDARTATRLAIEECSTEEAEPYQLDMTFIIFRINALAAEQQRRFIP